MSLLLIDMGNSYLKWTMASNDGALTDIHSCPIDSQPENNWLHSWDDCEKPQRIHVSCVSSVSNKQALVDYFKLNWQLSTDFLVSPESGHGITNAYSEPSRLGSDRWAAMVAAYTESHSAVLVVDAGTALTIDAIDKQGRHLGGMIFPGLNLTRSFLETGTQMDFESISEDIETIDFFAGSTEGGIVSGTMHAAVSLIDRACKTLAAKVGIAEPACYLTGGDARQITDKLECVCVVEPALVLKGLALIATTS